jgi:hypothetical protein
MGLNRGKSRVRKTEHLSSTTLPSRFSSAGGREPGRECNRRWIVVETRDGWLVIENEHTVVAQCLTNEDAWRWVDQNGDDGISETSREWYARRWLPGV